MTRQPPNRPATPEDRHRAALVQNLVGLLLLLVAAVGFGVIAWHVHPLLLAAYLCAGVGALGFLLATADAREA